ncbi:hypothetical protein KCU92_g9361, partial [Aureobasidium melanogenum]
MALPSRTRPAMELDQASDTVDAYGEYSYDSDTSSSSSGMDFDDSAFEHQPVDHAFYILHKLEGSLLRYTSRADKLPVNKPYDPNDHPECMKALEQAVDKMKHAIHQLDQRSKDMSELIGTKDKKTHTSTKNKNTTATASPITPPSATTGTAAPDTTTAAATELPSGATSSPSVENTTVPRSQGLHCANCNKTGSAMKICSRCRQEWYCSADCQKARWSSHKAFCNGHRASTAGDKTKKTSPTTKAKNLSKTVERPFHKLQARTWLHDRPESDVYKLLIDCFRLRQEDEYSFNGDVDHDSIYGGGPNSKAPFVRFLNQAKAAEDILPPWWSNKNTKACVTFGMERGNSDWSSLACCIEKHDIQDHYGSQDMPMQLRMLADQIYGCSLSGQSGSGMLEMKMMMEGATGGSFEEHRGGFATNIGL